MQDLIERPEDTKRLLRYIDQFPITLLSGPRRCGKTTLVRSLSHAHYFNLEIPEHADKFLTLSKAQPKAPGLIIIDEIQDRPEVLPFIKQWVDARHNVRILLLGSASFLIYPGSSSILGGRIAEFEFGGFILSDIGYENVLRHWLRGSFPESYLASDDSASFDWRREYIESFPYSVLLREYTGISPHVMSQLVRVLPQFNSAILNFSSIARTLEVTNATARRYIDLLTASGLTRVVCPLSRSGIIDRRRSSKLYIRDSGLANCLLSLRGKIDLVAHEMAPNLWEAYVVEALVRLLNMRQNDVSFWRDKTGAELDLVWPHGGSLFAVEIQYLSSPRMTDSMRKALDILELSHLWIIYNGHGKVSLADRITAISLDQLDHIRKMLSPDPEETAPFPQIVCSARRVFVSYSHKDDDFTKRLVKKLEDANINITMDTKSLRFGDSIDEFIRKSVRSTELTIMVVSQNSLRSPWVMAEFLETVFHEYVEEHRRLIPITIDKSVFETGLEIKLVDEIQGKIKDVNGKIIECLDKDIDIGRYVGVRQRLLDLKNNVAKAIDRLTSVLVGDFSDGQDFDQSLAKLIKSIKVKRFFID